MSEPGRANFVIQLGSSWSRTITYFDVAVTLSLVSATGARGSATATVTNGAASALTLNAGDLLRFGRGDDLYAVAASATLAAGASGPVTLTTPLNVGVTAVAVTRSAPVDLTTYTARMQVRATPDASAQILGLANGSGITLGGTAGTIALALTAAQLTTGTLDLSSITAPDAWLTEDLDAGGTLRGFGKLASYDLELVSGTTVTRVLQGRIVFEAEVTR